MSKIKKLRKRKVTIEYIPYDDFKVDDKSKIKGATGLKQPERDDEFFLYDNVTFELHKYDKDKHYKGFIPVNDGYIAIEKDLLFIFWLFLLILILSSLAVVVCRHNLVEDLPKPDIGGYEISDDSALKEKKGNSSNNVIIKGYDCLFLEEDGFVPLINSPKNSKYMRFEVYSEDDVLLHAGDIIDCGKEDRFYIKGIYQNGDCTIKIRAIEVRSDGTDGNGATYKTKLVMQ